MAKNRERLFREKASVLIQKCNWFEWSENIPSPEDLQTILRRVSPELPKNLELLDSVTEASEIIKAYQNHAVNIMLEKKEELINLIRYYFLAVLRVLKESYKIRIGWKPSDQHDHFERTIYRGLKVFWELTGKSAKFDKPEANSLIDSVAHGTEPLLCILASFVGPRVLELPYHCTFFRPLLHHALRRRREVVAHSWQGIQTSRRTRGGPL